jgi:tetratricopeptide (TPR) repeat protein/serine/threonine protein kinase
MRFPDLPGYRYEGLLGEDPFGWSFVALHESGKRRVVRVFKAQATSDRFLHPYFKTFSDPATQLNGVAKIHDYVLQTPLTLTACATPFYGWKNGDGDSWHVSSLDRLGAVLGQDQIGEVLVELAGCLGALHASGWFHGGVRPSGIFLTGKSGGGQNVHLGGFGQIFMGGLQYLEAGDHLFYAAPEQLAIGDFNEGRGKSWDVYAFGVIAFQLLTGHLPRLDRLRRYAMEQPEWLEDAAALTFGELSETTEAFLEHLAAERTVEWPTSALDGREESLRSVVTQCLQFEPSLRPASMTEVAAAIGRCDASVAPVSAARAPEKADAAMTIGSRTPFRAGDPGNAVDPGTVESDLLLVGGAGLGPVPSSRRAPMRFVEALRSSAVLRWQVVAIAALVAILPLTFFSLFYYLDARQAKKQVAADAAEFQAELQAKVNRQADAFRRDLTREKEQKEQLESVLNDIEGSQNNLLGQAKLARQILRQTQDNGDRFFRLVLENRDTDVPEFREGRAAALIEGRKHYERLVEAYGDAPDFIVSTANALFYLGQIYREMGEFGKSLAAFGEAERRYSALLEDASTSNVEFVKNIATSKSALGSLSIRSAQYSVARHYFTESSRFWTEARARDQSLATEAALHIHENSLAIVECEFAMDRLDAAGDAAMSVGVKLNEMQKADPGNHRIVGALAKSFTLVGRVLEARRDLETARKAYQQSSDLYAEAVKLDAAVDEYQLGLGNSLARVGLLSNDTSKLEGAAEVLGRVVASNPYESTYLKTLADIYGALAAGQRDGGKVKNAIALEEKAISVLKPILAGNRAVAPDVKFSYAQRLAHLAELLGDSGKFDESRAPLKEAITVLEEIAGGEGGVAEYHRTLARTRGMAGFASMKIGDKGEAKEHLEIAKTEWQTYMASNPDDNDAAQAVKWTAEQLQNLQ